MRCSRFTLLQLALTLTCGCAHWSDGDVELAQLPSPRMSVNSVAIEIQFVDVDAAVSADEIWSFADEQVIAPEPRRRINQNGFRCGLLGGELPPVVRQAIKQVEIAAADDIVGSGVSEANSRRRVLQSQARRRSKIVATETRDRMTVLLSEGGEIRGTTYQNAQCVFSVRTFPKGDGRVAVELTPEIEYGEAKQRWVGDEGAFRLDASKERHTFDEMRMEAVMSPGQTLVIAPLEEGQGIGGQFLGERQADGVQQKLLLIRLGQTQLDDLFAPERNQTPIVTLVD